MTMRVLWGVAVVAALLITVGIAVGARFDDGATDMYPVSVLVAKQTIPAGTPGTIATSTGMYARSTLPKHEVEEGAIADPQFLTGRAAAAEILPGQQLTAELFSP